MCKRDSYTGHCKFFNYIFKAFSKINSYYSRIKLLLFHDKTGLSHLLNNESNFPFLCAVHAFVGLYHLNRAQMMPLATQLENLFVFKKKKEKEINAHLSRSARLDSRTIDENGEFRMKYKLKNDKIIPSGRIVMAGD